MLVILRFKKARCLDQLKRTLKGEVEVIFQEKVLRICGMSQGFEKSVIASTRKFSKQASSYHLCSVTNDIARFIDKVSQKFYFRS